MFDTLLNDSVQAFPILGWALLALLVLVVQIFSRGIWPTLAVTLVGLLALIVDSFCHLRSSASVDVFSGSLRIDSSFLIFNLLGLFIHLAVVLILIPGLDRSLKLFQKSYEQLPELLICMLFSGLGFSVLIAANDLTTLFLGLETLSIGVYCLCGFYRTEIRSTESAFKYLMIGAFSTVLFLYGIAFVYGATGETNFAAIRTVIESEAINQSSLLILAIVFLVSAFAFKLALVPFHFYAPDVYEGAPTPVTAYLATVIKVGTIAAGARVFWGFLAPLAHYWEPFWVSLCVFSILIGNILALQQQTIKKLLAYSSISHSGFLGLALLVSQPGVGSSYAMMAYLVVYSGISLGIFALISFLETRDQIFAVDDLKGLGQKRFWPAFFIAIFVFGLAGLPPFAGFMIKFWVIQALVEQGYTVVAIAAVIGSLIGAAYYLRILMLMFMSEDTGKVASYPLFRDRFYAIRLVVILAALLTLIGGMRPQIYADWILSTLAFK